MKQVTHPADKLLYNKHGFIRVSDELKVKFDKAGMPAMNLVSWTGCVFGMLTYHLDELSGDVVFRWYEPGEKVPALQLPDLDEVEHLFKQFKQQMGIKPATKSTVVYEDDEL